MDPSIAGTGSCPKRWVNLVEHLIYSLYSLSLDLQGECNIPHPMLALIHCICSQPSLLAHLPSLEFQSSAVDTLADFLSIIIVLALTFFVFSSESLILLQSLISNLGLLQCYLL